MGLGVRRFWGVIVGVWCAGGEVDEPNRATGPVRFTERDCESVIDRSAPRCIVRPVYCVSPTARKFRIMNKRKTVRQGERVMKRKHQGQKPHSQVLLQATWRYFTLRVLYSEHSQRETNNTTI